MAKREDDSVENEVSACIVEWCLSAWLLLTDVKLWVVPLALQALCAWPMWKEA